MNDTLFSPEAMTKAIVKRTTDLLRDEFTLEVAQVMYRFKNVHKLELRYITSLLGVEGEIQLFILFSFDEPLIRKIFTIYAADLEIEANEHEMMLQETAGDLLNIVVGNVLAAFSQKGVRTVFSPPLTVTEAKNIVGYKGAMFNVAELETAHGMASIFCLGPKKLFDQQFSYKETK